MKFTCVFLFCISLILTLGATTKGDLDFGDAPEFDPNGLATNYPTTITNNGAYHEIDPFIDAYLGESVDSEPNGQPTWSADGDDLDTLYPSGGDDEDGVLFTSALIPGQKASVRVIASQPGFLYAWIDFGADGSWAEPADQIFNGQILIPNNNHLLFTVPNSATMGTTYARFRFTTNSTVPLGFAGGASDGEVEDYSVFIHEDLPPYIKWSQPPVINANSPEPDCFWGWNEISIYDTDQYPMVADDWRCSDYRPVSNIHWWGSYVDYQNNVPPANAPDSFHIGVWTDVPAGVDQPYSHPGTLVWEWTVQPWDLNETHVSCDFHPAYMPAPDSCFKYDFIIPQYEWFWQEGPDNIYWISIAAIYDSGVPEQNMWGWTTRPHYYNDDAVRIFETSLGTDFIAGEPIEEPEGYSWDMAFELSTPEWCPGDVTYTHTGYIPPVPPMFISDFDINLWDGPSGYFNTIDLQALIFLLNFNYYETGGTLGGELFMSPVPGPALPADVTHTHTGYIPPGPPDFIKGFDKNLWQGPDGKVDSIDLQALVILLSEENSGDPWDPMGWYYICP